MRMIVVEVYFVLFLTVSAVRILAEYGAML
jgi:hypothetical protein